ncbi:MAG: class I SAM-dependent methyltransferase [Flavobacteriales bacterium]|nr:class I SAM-dependent methyltransferase [Flavobacteriales bacterium]
MRSSMWKSESDWFKEWFNTEAYHLLYQNRSQVEANDFIQVLSKRFLGPAPKDILDIGCGNGRHALALADLGHNVIGLDLSEENIRIAQSHVKDESNTRFICGDMREIDKHVLPESIDVAFILFTSFGYFEREDENLAVLKHVKSILRPNGMLILDYLNNTFVRNGLVEEEVLIRQGTEFQIHRRIHQGWIEKSIGYKGPSGEDLHFVERVRDLSQDALSNWIEKAGLNAIQTFGNYQLDSLVSGSPRCILVARK